MSKVLLLVITSSCNTIYLLFSDSHQRITTACPKDHHRMTQKIPLFYNSYYIYTRYIYTFFIFLRLQSTTVFYAVGSSEELNRYRKRIDLSHYTILTKMSGWLSRRCCSTTLRCVIFKPWLILASNSSNSISLIF